MKHEKLLRVLIRVLKTILHMNKQPKKKDSE